MSLLDRLRTFLPSSSSFRYSRLPTVSSFSSTTHNGYLEHAHSNSTWRRACSCFSIPKRYARLTGGVLLALAIFLFLVRLLIYRYIDPGEPLPPLYKQWLEYEQHLPQHNLSLPFPEGKHAKYLYNANHVINSGFGNSLQETVFNAQLAYVTKRSFVFNNYTWSREPPEYSDWNGRMIPARIPLSAILSGPIVGGPFPPSSPPDLPRAISKDFFDIVCPPEQRRIIHTREIKNELDSKDADAQQRMDRWAEYFGSLEERCVEVYQETPILFNYVLMGKRSVLSIWPTLGKSPVLTEFSYSPLILSAFNTNRHFFQSGVLPSSRWHFPSFTSSSPHPKPWQKYRTIKSNPYARPPPPAPHVLMGLLVMHVRRNDFKEHCTHLAKWRADFNGFDTFPEFPDQFQLPPDGTDWNGKENIEQYRKRCYPTIEEIVSKVQEVKSKVDGLKKLYIMTNGNEEWLEKLKSALQGHPKMRVRAAIGNTNVESDGGWESIYTSRDLELTWEQKFVSQAVDMYVGSRAEAMIGNGFSSLTSNIVMLRMARGHSPDKMYFW